MDMSNNQSLTKNISVIRKNDESSQCNESDDNDPILDATKPIDDGQDQLMPNIDSKSINVESQIPLMGNLENASLENLSVPPITKPRPRRTVTYKKPIDKIIAIDRVHNGETKASVSRSIGVPESTIRGWCKNEKKIRAMCGVEDGVNEDLRNVSNTFLTYGKFMPAEIQALYNFPSAVNLFGSSCGQIPLENDPLLFASYLEDISAFNDVIQGLQHIHFDDSPSACAKLDIALNPNSILFSSTASLLNREYGQLHMTQNNYMQVLLARLFENSQGSN
ncbi:uncharacterized protein LOC142219668 [Haematobia irritans]|uniref:uncharacterized protein LOC142219668 n=1 Tax=Haematobia irritans TaxID=7368 RepID=UPI003F50074E